MKLRTLYSFITGLYLATGVFALAAHRPILAATDVGMAVACSGVARLVGPDRTLWRKR
jgi:hypothetical protein